MSPTQWIAWVGGPGPAPLIAKWTLLLGLAWLAHAALSGRDPRWRVLLWRGAAVGLLLIAGLALCPPLVTWTAPPQTPAIAVAQGPSAVPEQIIGAIADDPAPTIAEAGDVPPLDESSAAEPALAPAVESPPASPVDPWRTWDARPITRLLLIGWAVGVAILSARLALGAIQLGRLVRRATPADAAVIDAVRRVAAALGIRRKVEVRRTDDLPSPCLAGGLRPVLLLPSGIRPDELEAVLAHELGHVKGRDLLWNNILHLIAIPLWFHPLAWRIRSAHAAACDGVCDAIAATHLGDAASYGRALARIALRVSAPSPAQGLAMARTSDVGRRIRALNRRVFSRPLPRKLATAAMLAAALLASLLGGLGTTPAAPPEAPIAEADEQPAPEGAERIALRAVTDETREPIEGVEISYNYRKEGDPEAIRGKVVTDKDGRAAIERMANEKLTSFSITARKPKHVPVYFYWDGESHPINVPAEKELRLARGFAIGGVVRDEAGKPVAGARVYVTMPATESEIAAHHFDLGTPTTGEDGRWRVDEAPKDQNRAWIRIERDGYLRGFAEASHDLDSSATLKQGLKLSGRVLDREGKPIPGAIAIHGGSIWGTDSPRKSTDERGEFSLANCPPGPSVVTVQSQGYAPDLQAVAVDANAKPLEFRLGPAAVLKAQIVDRQGKPLAGAYISADTWRGHRSIRYSGKADREGRILWESAPHDAVTYFVGKEGYMRRELPLAANGEDQSIPLDPVLTIAGKVVDAKTGKPIPKFKLIRGFRFPKHKIDWSYAEAAEFADGQYTIQLDDGRVTHFLRIEAAGYAPSTSRELKPDEGIVALDVSLRADEGIAGTVVLPDGKPAAGAEVALATGDGHVLLENGRYGPGLRAPKVATGPDGHFALPNLGVPSLLIALNDFGYADATSEEFSRNSKLVLRPWGKIAGSARIGGEPASDQEITLQPANPPERTLNFIDTQFYSKTNGDGHFAFDRVPPGQVIITRTLIIKYAGGSSSQHYGWPTRVEAKAGEVATVQVGGTGRPVIGRVTFAEPPKVPADWSLSGPAEAWQKPSEWEEGLRLPLPYLAPIGEEGRFRIGDVPPGGYSLSIPIYGPRRVLVGVAKKDFLVPGEPGSRSDDPIDLGDIPAKPSPPEEGRLEPRPKPDARPAPEASGGTIAVRAITAEREEPIAGVEVSSSYKKRGAPEVIRNKVVTDKDGRSHSTGSSPAAESPVGFSRSTTRNTQPVTITAGRPRWMSNPAKR